MATAWKLGTGASYSAISGFTWPTGKVSATVIDRPINKLNKTQPLPGRDTPSAKNQGTANIPVSISGTFFSKTDLDGIMKQAGMSVVSDDGSITDLIQRLYFEGDTGSALTDYVYVKNGVAKMNRNAANPLGYAYVANFIGMDPFIYTDNGASNTYESAEGASPRSVSSIANAGAAYAFPTLEIVNHATGSSITQIVITYAAASLTMTWNGTLPVGSTLRITQEFDETTGRFGFNSYIGSTETGSVSGDRMIFQASATGKTLSCAFTGGSGGAIFRVIVPKRRWG